MANILEKVFLISLVFLYFMKVFIEKDNLEKVLDFSGTCAELLKKLGVNSEEVLIVKNNELVSLDDECESDDEIRLLSVVSGG